MTDSFVSDLRETLGLHVVEGENDPQVKEEDVQCLLEVARLAHDDAVKIIKSITHKRWHVAKPNTNIVDNNLKNMNMKIFQMFLRDCYITETLLISKKDIEQYIIPELQKISRVGYHFLDYGDYIKITNDWLRAQTSRVVDYVFDTIRQFLENLNIRNIQREHNKDLGAPANYDWDTIVNGYMMRHIRTKLAQDAKLDISRMTALTIPMPFDNYISYHFWDNVIKDEDATFVTYKQCDENTLGIRLYLNTNHLIKEIEKGKERLGKPDEYFLVYETVDEQERMRTRYYELTDDDLRDYLREFLKKRYNDVGRAYISNYEINRGNEMSRGEMIRLLVLLDNE